MGAWVMPIGALGRPPQGGTCHSVSSTQRGFRLYSSPPLHRLSSESRHCSVSLGCLVSRIIHHLEHSWPPWVTKVDLPAGVLPFSKIDGLSDLQALRLPPLARGGAARDEKTKGPFLGRRQIGRPDALALRASPSASCRRRWR